tara:strand:- start:63 stop:2669 length:2607 start_codon:yes stop_codon:yes gene_type:complete
MSCSDEILEAARQAGIKLDDEEVKEILDVLNERLKKRVSNAGSEENLEIFSLAQKIAKEAKISAAIIRRSRLLNAKAYSRIMNKIKANPGKESEALSAILVGDIRFFEGLDSVDANQKATSTRYEGELAAALLENDLLPLFKSGELDELIYEAMFDIDTFDINRAGAKEAKEIAEIVQKSQKKILKAKNRNGALVRELKNYIVRQGHDPKLLKAGAKTTEEFEAAKNDWVAYMLEPDRLDERTFDSKPTTKDGKPYSREDFLGDMWKNLISRNHRKVDAQRGMDGSVDPLTAFKGEANLAKKQSQSRLIHFKTGKAAYDYAKKYNKKQSLLESIVSGIHHDSQSIALMEKFGTNPKAMFDRIVKDIEDIAKEKPGTKIKKGRLKNQFAELDGSTRALGADTTEFYGADLAAIGGGVRIVQSMSKLGMATISSFSDIASKVSFLNTRTDRGIFGSYAIALAQTFKMFPPKEQRQLALLLNVGVDRINNSIHSRFSADDSMPGFMSKANSTYFTINGMNWWNSTQKEGVAAILSADLATYSELSFEDIPTRTRLNLQRYGIQSEDWNILKQIEKTALDGTDYLTPRAVEDLPNSVIEGLVLKRENLNRKRKIKSATPDMIDRYKEDLIRKYGTYLTDGADSAVPTPGAKELAIMNQGLERGTPKGEAIRTLMQLKAFPITMITKGLTRQYYAKKQAGQSGVVGLAQMMIGMTMMGYVSMSLKDILKGKEPLKVFSEDNYLKKETLTKAMTQGGGFGLYGDFLFGEYNKYGQSLTQSLIGPTFGVIDDIARVYGSAIEGDSDKIMKQGVGTVIRNVPGANLFYTKMALDYLFIYGLTEKVNPGYLRRMERRMKKDSEQEFYLPPSRYAQKF